ncbi:MAG: hypothetical protein R3E91_05060 [Chlamydiales bacterium]
MAVERGDLEIVRMILDACPESRNHLSTEGKFPIEYAISHNDMAIVEELFDPATINNDQYLKFLMLATQD